MKLMSAKSRWSAFTDEELQALLAALQSDPGKGSAYLAGQIAHELSVRGLLGESVDTHSA